jgi:hypothetical protein
VKPGLILICLRTLSGGDEHTQQLRGGRVCVTSTYDPSGRRDSGMTRSSVRGSTAMPAAVVSG